MSDASTAAVAQLIQDLEPGSMVTKFVVVAEIIGPDGERYCISESHDGASDWDTYGLLYFGIDLVNE